jgi:hypothetical protein
VAPFGRSPGLLRQTSVEHYLTSRSYMTWSVDFLADDWTHISAQEVARRAIARVEARGRGILLLHDIQPATALAFPEILRELKLRGFKIVHVVPATPDRPKTVTEPAQWAVKRPSEQKMWPRTLAIGEAPAPVLTAPSPVNFAVEDFGGRSIKVALAHTFERPSDGDAPPPLTEWPRPAIYAVPAEAQLLPLPGAHNFRYARPFRSGLMDKPKTKKPPAPATTAAATTGAPTTTTAKPNAAPTGAKPREPQTTSGGLFSFLPLNRTRPVGHQLTVARPPTNLTAPQQR